MSQTRGRRRRGRIESRSYWSFVKRSWIVDYQVLLRLILVYYRILLDDYLLERVMKIRL